MSLSLAGEEWQSSVVFHSTSPEWDEMHEFLAPLAATFHMCFF